MSPSGLIWKVDGSNSESNRKSVEMATRKTNLVESFGSVDNHAPFHTQQQKRFRHLASQMLRMDANNNLSRFRGVCKGSKEIENGREPHFPPDRAHVLHCRMVGLRKKKSKPAFPQDRWHGIGQNVPKMTAKGFKYVGRARRRGSGTVPVLSVSMESDIAPEQRIPLID